MDWFLYDRNFRQVRVKLIIQGVIQKLKKIGAWLKSENSEHLFGDTPREEYFKKYLRV